MSTKKDTRDMAQVADMIKNFKKLGKSEQQYVAGLIDGLKTSHHITKTA